MATHKISLYVTFDGGSDFDEDNDAAIAFAQWLPTVVSEITAVEGVKVKRIQEPLFNERLATAQS